MVPSIVLRVISSRPVRRGRRVVVVARTSTTERQTQTHVVALLRGCDLVREVKVCIIFIRFVSACSCIVVCVCEDVYGIANSNVRRGRCAVVASLRSWWCRRTIRI